MILARVHNIISSTIIITPLPAPRPQRWSRRYPPPRPGLLRRSRPPLPKRRRLEQWSHTILLPRCGIFLGETSAIKKALIHADSGLGSAGGRPSVPGLLLGQWHETRLNNNIHDHPRNLKVGWTKYSYYEFLRPTTEKTSQTGRIAKHTPRCQNKHTHTLKMPDESTKAGRGLALGCRCTMTIIRTIMTIIGIMLMIIGIIKILGTTGQPRTFTHVGVSRTPAQSPQSPCIAVHTPSVHRAASPSCPSTPATAIYGAVQISQARPP